MKTVKTVLRTSLHGIGAAVLTWQLSSPGSCSHLAAVLTSQLFYPGSCPHLAAVLTWQLFSPGSCPHLTAVLSWQLSSSGSCSYSYLAAVLTRNWQLFLLVPGSCSYSYLAAVLAPLPGADHTVCYGQRILQLKTCIPIVSKTTTKV